MICHGKGPTFALFKMRAPLMSQQLDSWDLWEVLKSLLAGVGVSQAGNLRCVHQKKPFSKRAGMINLGNS